MTVPTRFLQRSTARDLRMQWSSAQARQIAHPLELERLRARVAHAVVILEREMRAERAVDTKAALGTELHDVESLRDEITRLNRDH